MTPDSTKAAPIFGRGPSSTARLILLGLASILLMMADSRGHYLDRIHAALSTAVYPLQRLAALPAETGGWISERWTTRAGLLEENEQLERANRLLRGRLQRFMALQQENERLRALMNAAATRSERVTVAEIVQVDLAPSSHQVLINRGSQSGVYVGQPVLDANGVMGQIVEVGPVSAYAMLISDPGHALPVQFNRTGLRSIARGTGRANALKLGDLPLSADMRIGDWLVTSGLGGRFPPGLPVARVTRIERDPGQAFANVYATPAAALNRSRHVLLIWPEKPVEAPPETSAE